MAVVAAKAAGAIFKLVWPYLLAAAVLWLAYSWADGRGYMRAQAECAGKAAAQADRNEAAASRAAEDMNKTLGQVLPGVEEKAHASVERIRTVYVDRPVPAECAWSGGVLQELEAGRAAANRSVRGGTGGADSPDPR